jgi:hypothetical protein
MAADISASSAIVPKLALNLTACNAQRFEYGMATLLV